MTPGQHAPLGESGPLRRDLHKLRFWTLSLTGWRLVGARSPLSKLGYATFGDE